MLAGVKKKPVFQMSQLMVTNSRREDAKSTKRT